MNRQQYRAALEAKVSQLTASLRNREGLTLAAETDEFDEMQQGMERDLTMLTLDRESALLKCVRAALARLDDGSFGTCLDCGEQVSAKRLAAVPWAALCLHCQEQADLRSRQTDEEVPSPSSGRGLSRAVRSMANN